jgi:hypothetical protein
MRAITDNHPSPVIALSRELKLRASGANLKLLVDRVGSALSLGVQNVQILDF